MIVDSDGGRATRLSKESSGRYVCPASLAALRVGTKDAPTLPTALLQFNTNTEGKFVFGKTTSTEDLFVIGENVT